MPITNSLDWQMLETTLKQQIAYIKDDRRRNEVKKMLKNFDPMITKLSKLELLARTSPSQSRRNVTEQLDLINSDLLQFEQWITLLLLM